MKKYLEKTVISCIIVAFAIMIGFSGCGKDYDPQLSYMNGRIDSTRTELENLRNELNTRVAQLQTLINNKVFIESVTPITTGAGGFKIVLSNGSQMDISNGSNGTPGSVWDISNDGYWTCDGVKTQYRAVGVNAQAPFISQSDTTWQVPQWNETANRYDTIATNVKATGGGSGMIAYVTGNAGNYTLHIRNDNNSLLHIPLSASTSGAVFELLGYVQGAAINPTSGLSLKSIIDTMALNLYFWHIPSTFTEWNYQKRVRANQAVSAIGKMNTALVISTNIDPAQLNLKFRNYSGTAIPLVFGTPIAFNGILTRAHEPYAGSIYFIPVADIDTTVYPIVTGFVQQFLTEAVYYLVDETSGLKSNYTAWSINPLLQSNPPQPSNIDKLGTVSAVSGEYTVPKNTDIGVTFDGNGTYVYDYYISYNGSRAGITTNHTAGTFKTTVDITPVDTLVIHKLYTNGTLQHDTVKIKTQ